MSKRSDRYKNFANSDIDLVPMMNLLSILIPVLLISTEYIKLANIPVSQPILGPKTQPPPEDVEKPPLNLTLMITSKGIYVNASGKNVSPDGAAADPAASTEPAVEKTSVTSYYGKKGEGDEELMLQVWDFDGRKFMKGVQEIKEEDLLSRVDAMKERETIHDFRQRTEQAYDYPKLNKILADIKAKFPDEKKVILNAEPNVSYEVLVRVMDTARYRIDRSKLSEAELADFAADSENGLRRRRDRMQQLREQDFLFPVVIISGGIS